MNHGILGIRVSPGSSFLVVRVAPTWPTWQIGSMACCKMANKPFCCGVFAQPRATRAGCLWNKRLSTRSALCEPGGRNWTTPTCGWSLRATKTPVLVTALVFVVFSHLFSSFSFSQNSNVFVLVVFCILIRILDTLLASHGDSIYICIYNFVFFSSLYLRAFFRRRWLHADHGGQWFHRSYHQAV